MQVSDYVISQIGIVVALSVIVERALSVVFGTRVFVEKWSGKSIKEMIAVAVSIVVCIYWKVDVVAALVHQESGYQKPLGMVLTAGVIAGGSKAALKLFQDILGIKTKAEREEQVKLENEKQEKQQAPPQPA